MKYRTELLELLADARRNAEPLLAARLSQAEEWIAGRPDLVALGDNRVLVGDELRGAMVRAAATLQQLSRAWTYADKLEAASAELAELADWIGAVMRDGATVARAAHNREVGGSTPPPAIFPKG